MKNIHKEYPIDFVITWVDGNDLKWQKEYFKYKGIDGDQRVYRFRDMDLLQYWFRGVEKFAPWVNKIYFVTCGQQPAWLNTKHPKLTCIDHTDFIPEKYLPTFSSHAIELNLHRIPELCEHFVYFNDDTFITNIVKVSDFFKNGIPCDSAVINYFAPRKDPLNLVPFVNAAVINRNFSKKDVMLKYAGNFFTLKNRKYLLKNIQFIMGKWFPGFKHFHQPSSFLKSVFEEIWEKEYDLLNQTCLHKFRIHTDVNQWLIKNWQICTGKTAPRDVNIGYYGVIDSKNALLKTCDAIKSKKYKLVCANDENIPEFEFMKTSLKEAFEKILSDKSGFEL